MGILSKCVSYELSKKWSIGFGLNYIHSDLASGAIVSEEEFKTGRALSADIGTIYNTSFSVADSWLIQTGFGISITDFGNLIKYTDNAEGDPLPMKFRTGLGLEAVYSGDWNGFKWIGMSSAVSLSKLLVALEYEENGSVKRFGPFQTIVKAWDVYKEQNPNNGEFTEYSLSEQFIYHAGVELTFFESFSFRMGYQNGQELNDFESLSSWGIGIDLYYLALDYMNSSHTSEDYKDQETLIGAEYLQLKGRIPLDGKSPKSLLRLLFD
ncbi:MAG: PorV/PorQ family protein [Balneola sp.]|nr:PorV/PorQ family protein [Balneola sp.]